MVLKDEMKDKEGGSSLLLPPDSAGLPFLKGQVASAQGLQKILKRRLSRVGACACACAFACVRVCVYVCVWGLCICVVCSKLFG